MRVLRESVFFVSKNKPWQKKLESHSLGWIAKRRWIPQTIWGTMNKDTETQEAFKDRCCLWMLLTHSIGSISRPISTETGSLMKLWKAISTVTPAVSNNTEIFQKKNSTNVLTCHPTKQESAIINAPSKPNKVSLPKVLKIYTQNYVIMSLSFLILWHDQQKSNYYTWFECIQTQYCTF